MKKIIKDYPFPNSETYTRNILCSILKQYILIKQNCVYKNTQIHKYTILLFKLKFVAKFQIFYVSLVFVTSTTNVGFRNAN